MEDIATRLKEASQTCLEAFSAWEGKKKDSKAQEELHSAIHELRKVSSRLEIELAISERDQMTSKPIPIPAHRSNSKGDNGSILEGNDDNQGGPVVQSSKPRRKRTSKKSS
jgi:hypothetical protein